MHEYTGSLKYQKQDISWHIISFLVQFSLNFLLDISLNYFLLPFALRTVNSKDLQTSMSLI